MPSVPKQTHPENTNATASTSDDESGLQTICYLLILLGQESIERTMAGD